MGPAHTETSHLLASIRQPNHRLHQHVEEAMSWLINCEIPGCGYVTPGDSEEAMLADVAVHEWNEHAYIHTPDV